MKLGTWYWHSPSINTMAVPLWAATVHLCVDKTSFWHQAVVRAHSHTTQVPSNSSNNKISKKNTGARFMWRFFSDEGNSIQPIIHLLLHLPTCSLSIRFITKALLRCCIKVKCCIRATPGCAAPLCVLQTCPFRKQTIRRSHQLHKRAYRIAEHLRCGSISWMKAGRGSDHNKRAKGWTINYGVE